jgi:hypothetical protein
MPSLVKLGPEFKIQFKALLAPAFMEWFQAQYLNRSKFLLNVCSIFKNHHFLSKRLRHVSS